MILEARHPGGGEKLVVKGPSDVAISSPSEALSAQSVQDSVNLDDSKSTV
jgi:hypothetical protein